MSWRKKRLLVVSGRGCGIAESPTYASEIDPFGVSLPVAKEEGWKYSSRSLRWVMVMLVDEADVTLQPWACSSVVTLAIVVLIYCMS
jgi:hypothetical protein